MGEETLSDFLNFPRPLRLLINVNYNAASEKMDGNCNVFANSRWAILPSLLLADVYYLGISSRLSNTFKELPRGYPIAFWHFPAVFFPHPIAQWLFNSLSKHFPAAIDENVTVSVHLPRRSLFTFLNVKILRQTRNEHEHFSKSSAFLC
jgi:hypothetical protein